MKKLLTILFCAAMLLACAAAALADGNSAYTDTPPAEVISHLAGKFPDHTLEDYIAIKGTSNGDYGFALIVSGKNRALLAYHAENGVMSYWRKNADAVPQGEGVCFFSRHSANTVYEPGATDKTFGNDLGFTVVYLDTPGAESWAASISFHWQDGAFKLVSYFGKNAGMSALVSDAGVTFYDSGWSKVVGRVNGTVQRDFRYVSFSALPKTLDAAKKKLTVAPAIPAGELEAQNIRFTGGQRYEVYSAPSDGPGVLRGGNGKAVVSTNDWIQVFGEEDGWILIQYAIDSQHMRFGYIPAESLPKNARVAPLVWDAKVAYLAQDTSLTDDPLYSQSKLLSLPQGQSVWVLATMGDWAYVESGSGDWARGFVKQELLFTDSIYYLADHSENLATGTMAITPYGRLTLVMGVKTNNVPAAFLLKDELQGIVIGTAKPIDNNDYRLEGSLPEGTTSISFIPVDENGTPGETLFRVEW